MDPSRGRFFPHVQSTCSSQTTVRTPSGVVVFRAFDGDAVAPIAFSSSNGGGAISFDPAAPFVHLAGDGVELTLDRRGATISSIGIAGRTSDRPVRVALEAEHRKTDSPFADASLRRALLVLRRDLWLAMVEAVALTDVALTAATTKVVLSAADDLLSLGQNTSHVECDEQRVVSYVTEEAWGWVDHVTTVTEQALECSRGCIAKGGWGVAGCLLDCAKRTFSDLSTSTWELLSRTTTEVVTWETHCVEVDGPSIPTSVGRLPDDAGEPSVALSAEDAQKVLQPFAPLLDCLARSEWHLWRVDVPFGIAGDVPIGFRVCIDRACADRIAAEFTWDHIVSEVEVLKTLLAAPASAALIADALTKTPVIGAALPGIAAAVGLSLPQAVLLVLACVAFIAYHGLAVAGQIKLQEALGHATSGVCLQHPLFVLGPTLPVVAMNTPLIVTGRP